MAANFAGCHDATCFAEKSPDNAFSGAMNCVAFALNAVAGFASVSALNDVFASASTGNGIVRAGAGSVFASGATAVQLETAGPWMATGGAALLNFGASASLIAGAQLAVGGGGHGRGGADCRQ
jgi:hypothetical protein